MHMLSGLNALPIFVLLGVVVVFMLRARGRRWRNVVVAAQGAVGAALAMFTLLIVRVFQVLF